MMKNFALALAFLCQVTAFTVVGPVPRASSRLCAEYEPLEGESKINLKVCMVDGFFVDRSYRYTLWPE